MKRNEAKKVWVGCMPELPSGGYRRLLRRVIYGTVRLSLLLRNLI